MKTRDWRSVVVILLTVVLSVSAAIAGEKPLPQVKTRVNDVAVFKDGYGFFVRAGKSRLQKGWAEFDVVPNAVLGTVWVYSDRADEPVDLLVRSTKEVERTGKAVNMLALLKANLGDKIVITTQDKTRIAGLLTYVSESSGTPVVPEESRAMPPENFDPFLMVKTEDGTIVTFRFWQIQQVDFQQEPTLDSPLPAEKEPVLRAKVLTKRNEAMLGLAYLEQGIRWLPSYLVILQEGKQALVSLRATVVNEVEDLEETRLGLVIGVPHFSAKGELDPVGLQKALAATPEFRDLGRAMMSQMAPRAMGGAMAEEMAPAPPPPGELAGEAMEELYIYHKDDITLRKGERAQIVLLTGEVPYQDVYDWDADAGEEVWHSVKLTNTLKAPWTTGLAMTVKAAQPLGQDMLKYTPAGASTNVKITQAADIRVSRKEEETARGKPENVGGYMWSLVTIKGELKLENYKKAAVEVEVTKTVTGRADLASDEAEMIVQPSPGQGLNPNTSLKWKISVAPGKTKSLTYQYRVYVRV